MTNHEIVLNGVVIGKVFETIEETLEVWVSPVLVQGALEDLKPVVFSH